MRIIAMQGRPDSGKSSAIRKVYDAFSKTASVVILFRPLGSNADFEAVVKTRSGKRVGFFSQGDCGDDAIHNIDAAENAGCDILVTAVRTKGATHENIFAYCKKSPDHEVLLINGIDMWTHLNPTSPIYDKRNDFSAISDLMAKHLLNVLDYVIRMI